MADSVDTSLLVELVEGAVQARVAEQRLRRQYADELLGAAYVRGAMITALDGHRQLAVPVVAMLPAILLEQLVSDRGWPEIEHELREWFLRDRQLHERRMGRG